MKSTEIMKRYRDFLRDIWGVLSKSAFILPTKLLTTPALSLHSTACDSNTFSQELGRKDVWSQRAATRQTCVWSIFPVFVPHI